MSRRPIVSSSVAQQLLGSAKVFKKNIAQMGSSDQHLRSNTRDKNKLSELMLNIISHNVRGLVKDQHIEECLAFATKSKAWATCLQETWMVGNTTHEHNNTIIINHGPPKKLCNRGSLGVAIVLGPHARKCWEKAGCQQLYYGERILATRLKIEDARGKPMTMFLVSAYAPIGAAKREARENYANNMQQCIAACGKKETLVICTDANASVGVRDINDDPYKAGRDQVRGPFGISHQNKAGRELLGILGPNELCLPLTYFRKKRYDTWINPCNKLGHQLDHVIVRQADLKRIRDAGRYGIAGKDSDHYPIRITIAIACKFKHKPTSSTRTRIDRGLLKEPDIESNFIDIVKNYCNDDASSKTAQIRLTKALQAAASEVLTTESRKQPSWYEAAATKIEPAIRKRNALQAQYNAPSRRLNVNSAASIKLREKLREARKEVKIEVRKAENAWLEGLVNDVNGDGFAKGRPQYPSDIWKAIVSIRQGKSVTKKLTPMTLRKDDGNLCTTPQENAEIMSKNLNNIFNKTGSFDPTAIDAVKQRDSQPYLWMANKPTDKEIATAIRKLGQGKSGAESKCYAEYYKTLEKDTGGRMLIRQVLDEYWTTGSYTGEAPTAEEATAEEAAAKDAATKEAEYKAPFFVIGDMQRNNTPITFAPNPHSLGSKAFNKYSRRAAATTIKEALKLGATSLQLEKDFEAKLLTATKAAPTPSTRAAFDADADKDGMVYEDWQVARLKLLPKKGDLSKCKNWRGICLLDIASKILSSIMTARLSIVQEDHGLEAQAGFRWHRGTIDGSFSTTLAMQKRKEHGLATWAVFIDLVKAFDTVNREAAFAVLRKFGLPDHFINIVIRLHTNATIKFKVGEVDTAVPSSIGVRQGSVEGPSLFLFIMQAALETVDWPAAKPLFSTRAEGVTQGERWDRKKDVELFNLWMSLFADDCALLFTNREDMIAGTNHIYHHLKRFGLLMHIGKVDASLPEGKEKSKTEAMYCEPRGTLYENGDTSDFDVHDGFVSFTPQFKYLGSHTHHTLTSEADVDARITSATSAFGALRRDVFSNKRVKLKTKGRLYRAFVLSILLYGSECWCLTEKLFARVRKFHNSCVRVMCRVKMCHVIRHHITTTTLLDKLHLNHIDHYYNSRLLRWAGHVSRMDMTRTPRKLLTGWVANPRPNGRPPMTFGHTLKKALLSKGLPANFDEWHRIAADRPRWRQIHTKVTD